MVIRDTTYYAFTKSAEPSVFSSETHLNWHWCLLRQNSQGQWKVRDAKIRISTYLDIPLSSLNFDLPIGMTLTLLRNTNPRQWCDICKMRYGSHRGEFHPKAQTPAYWKALSQNPKRANQVRFYCLDCAAEIQNWPDGSFYSLKEQLLDGLREVVTREQLNVELPR